MEAVPTHLGGGCPAGNDVGCRLALLLIALNFLAEAILDGYGGEVMLGLDCEQGRVPARGRGR